MSVLEKMIKRYFGSDAKLVPARSSSPTAVVFTLHATGRSGEKFTDSATIRLEKRK